eukprot:2335902-Lingulodinium_polyedra.AAC.1
MHARVLVSDVEEARRRVLPGRSDREVLAVTHTRTHARPFWAGRIAKMVTDTQYSQHAAVRIRRRPRGRCQN